MLKQFLFDHPVKFAGRYLPCTYPRTLGIALTRKCNLSCFMCRSLDETGQDLEFGNLVKLKTAIRHADIIEFCGEGESLGYPWIENTIKFIYSLNDRRKLFRIFTNGTTLSQEMALLLGKRIHYLRISLNAATPDTYRLITRRGDLEITIRCIKEFLAGIEPCDKSRIHLHFVASTLNYKEIPSYIELSYKLGIPNVSIRNIEVSRKELLGYSLLSIPHEYDEAVVRARELACNLGIKLDARTFGVDRGLNAKLKASEHGVQDTWVRPQCEMLRNAFVELDGGISPCNNSGSYRIGNVYRDGFESAWFCPEYLALRKTQHMPACDRCIYCMPLNDKAAHITSHFVDSIP